MSDDLVARAMVIAFAVHARQRRAGGESYFRHPARVADAARRAGHGPEVIQAAWLHDVVEDSDLTLDDLRALGFSEAVVSAVDSVSRRKGEETYMDMVRRARAHPIGRVVKLLDNADNSDPEQLAAFEGERREFAERRYRKAREVLES